MNPTCKTCKHYIRQIDPTNVSRDSGVCRYNPPSPMLVPQPGGVGLTGVFPPVESGNFCGKHDAALQISTN